MPIPLIGLAAQLVPTLVRWIGGDKAGEVAERVAGVAGEVLGTTDAAEIEAKLAADPAALMTFRTRLAEIDSEYDQRRHAEVLARLADVASARTQTVELARVGSPIAWVAPAVTAAVFALTGGCLWAIFTMQIPEGQRDIVYMAVGQVLTFAAAAVGYWLGNSVGARQSADTMRQITERAVGGR